MTSIVSMISDMKCAPAPAEAESLVAMGERALYVDGDLAAARSGFTRAYELAEKAGAGRLMAAAALGLGGLWVHEHRPVAEAAGIEARQRTALSLLDPRSSLALRLRARLAAEADYRAGRYATIRPIVEEARRAGDPVALAEALSLAHHCLLGPEHAGMRLEIAEELLRAGSRTHRPSDVVLGLLWRTADLFMLGNPHAERSFAELSGCGETERNAAAGFVVSAMRVMLSIRSGRLGEAERFAADCAERGRVAGDADHLGWYGAQLVAIRWYQGRVGELVGTLSEIVNSPMLSAVDNAFLAALAVAAASTGDSQQAYGALARISGSCPGRTRGARSPTVLVWQFAGKPGNLTAQNQYTQNSGYNMFCQTNSEYLTYKKQKFGINLGYTSDAGVLKTHFRLPDGQERPILTGETVALGIGAGDEFLYYGHRTIGINLKWSGPPKYEWRIYGPTGENGQPIPTGSPVAILNLNVKPSADFLIFLNRHPGTADVGWTTSPNWWPLGMDSDTLAEPPLK